MTLADALDLRKGDYVTHAFTAPPDAPCRVTEVWQNAKSTIVLIRIASIAKEVWLDATGYELPPPRHEWDAATTSWVPAAPAPPFARKKRP